MHIVDDSLTVHCLNLASCDPRFSGAHCLNIVSCDSRFSGAHCLNIVGNVSTGFKDLEMAGKLLPDIDEDPPTWLKNMRQPSLLAVFQLDSRTLK